MKPSSLIALGTAVVGFALGWMLKPSPETETAVVTGNEPPPRSRPDHSELIAPAARSQPQRELKVPNVDELAGAEVPEGGPPSLLKQEIASRLAGNRDRARLARFAEALGLDDSQLDAIATLISQHKGATTATGNSLLHDAANGDGDFEKSLHALLDDDQKRRLDAFKTRAAENQIESNAQQDLASVMKTVDLSAGQRTQVLEAFRERVRQSDPPPPSGWDLVTGRRNPLAGGGAAEAYRDLFSDPSVANDPQEFAKRLREERTRIADEKTETLVEVLTPAQLAEYRAALEASFDPNTSLFGKSIRDPKFR